MSNLPTLRELLTGMPDKMTDDLIESGKETTEDLLETLKDLFGADDE